MSKKVLCLGISGQVGSYLSEFLLDKGYEVHGIIRRSSNFNTQRIDHIFDKLHLHYGDLEDFCSLQKTVKDIQPDYMYNLACQSHVKLSFEIPNYTFMTAANGVLNCLEAIKTVSPHTRFLNSGSSEQFGNSPPPQSETTPFLPCSPYAVGKVAATHLVKNYREAYNMFACSSICFNMESPRRGETFVTKKIISAAVKIKLGKAKELILGNTNSLRSFQHAKCGARAMILMMEADKPKDYVISANEMCSIQNFVEIVFNKLNLDWKEYIVIDPKYFRPKEVNALEGNSNLIKKELGWEPEYDLNQLIDEMIEYEFKANNCEFIKQGDK